MKFTCVDCTQNLKNQTTLECFHHLCNECLRKEIQQQHNANSEKNDKVLLCCSCGYPTPLEKLSTCNQTHSSYFKSPQIIRALFDFEYGTHFPTCVSCKNRGKTTESSVWCYDCVEHYCKECLTFHSSLPLFEKHKTYSLDDVKKEPKLFIKARELCDEHSLRFTKFCSEKGIVCCDQCISCYHLDVCDGKHTEIKQDIISKTVIPQACTLRKTIEEILGEITIKENEINDVESKIKLFLKEKQKDADEKGQNLKKTILDLTDVLIAESYKKMFFSLQNKEARITDLKQRKSVLENAADIVSVSKGVSDIRYFLEMRKIKRIIMNASIILSADERGGTKGYDHILFENCLDKFSDLDAFGKIEKVQMRSNQTNPVSVTLSAWKSEENFSEKSGLRLTTRYQWVSELNLSSAQGNDSTHVEPICFQFGRKRFTFSKSIEIESGSSHVTGCDWISESEIVIVDRGAKRRPEIRVYDIFKEALKTRTYLRNKPYDVVVLPKCDKCVVTFPNEMKFQIISLTDFSVENEISVGVKCYGVCHFSDASMNSIILCGESKLVFYDRNQPEFKERTVLGEDIRYVHTQHDRIVYSDLLNNYVHCTTQNGTNTFRITSSEFKGAAGLLLDEDENIYLCDKRGKCVNVINKYGIFIRKFEVGQTPTKISVSKNKQNICIIRGGQQNTNVADIYFAN